MIKTDISPERPVIRKKVLHVYDILLEYCVKHNSSIYYIVSEFVGCFCSELATFKTLDDALKFVNKKWKKSIKGGGPRGVLGARRTAEETKNDNP